MNFWLRGFIRRLLLTVTLGLSLTRGVDGQNEQWEPPQWVGDLTFGATNALLGGLSAGVLQQIRGGSFKDGFTSGALGGLVVYGGKRLASGRFFGAGLVGRELSAIGSSMTRNASYRVPLLSELVLPVGPLRVYLRPRTPHGTTLRLSASEMGAILWGATRSELRFDLERSISSGAFTFHAPRHVFRSGEADAVGVTVMGTILLSPVLTAEAFVHERIHVIQRDFFNTVWGRDLEAAIGSRIRPVAVVRRFFDIDYAIPILRSLLITIVDVGRTNSLLELEADFLEPR